MIVDIQPKFLDPIFNKAQVLRRARFLASAANLLGVRTIATEQVPDKMGGTEPELADLLGGFGVAIHPKQTFSCYGCPGFDAELLKLRPKQVVLCGIETHICVTQTAIHAMDLGARVFIAADAVGSRSEEQHRIGMERMVASGVIPAHSESIVYEWMGTADHAKFRDVLRLVKDA